jgi:protein subunit release factor B
MGNKSDYLDLILEQARHILVQARVPMADVTSSLLEVWQRRKDSTARYFRQKARERRQALQASRATDIDVSWLSCITQYDSDIYTSCQETFRPRAQALAQALTSTRTNILRTASLCQLRFSHISATSRQPQMTWEVCRASRA